MRFMADQSNVIYFIGLKELMIDFGDNGIYD